MNKLTLKDVKSTRELAKELNCNPKTIFNIAKKCLPNKIIKNGKPTYWNEAEVTVLLEQMKISNPNQYNLGRSLQGYTTELTPALRIRNAMLEMQSAYEEELAILREKNVELQEHNNQLNHALEYDKVSGWKSWSSMKKELGYRGNFSGLINECALENGIDYEKKVMGYDKYPTTLISKSGEYKILEYMYGDLDESEWVE